MGLFSGLISNAGEVKKEDLQKDYGKLLIAGEEIEVEFKLIRDTFIFTAKRLILIDKQGLTGSKTEYKSISYKSISRFSVESSGRLIRTLSKNLGFERAGAQHPKAIQ